MVAISMMASAALLAGLELTSWLPDPINLVFDSGHTSTHDRSSSQKQSSDLVSRSRFTFEAQGSG